MQFDDAGDGTWENGANWTGDTTDDSLNGPLPDTSDDAFINSGQTATLSSAQSINAYFINDGGALNVLSGGALTTLNNGNSFVGSSTSSPGTMNIEAGGSVSAARYRVIGGGVANVNGGTISASNRLYVEASTMNIVGSGGAIDAGFLRLYTENLSSAIGGAVAGPVLNFVFDENGVTPIISDGEVGLDYIDGDATESLSELKIDLTGLTGLAAGTYEYTLINGGFGLSEDEFAFETITGVDGTYITDASVVYDTDNDDVLLSVTSSGRTAVPEPASLVLLGAGAGLLLGGRRSASRRPRM